VSDRVRNPGEWDLGEVVDPAEFELLDEGQAEAVDGRGGSYAPTTPILIGGRGIEDCNSEHHLYDAAEGSVTLGPTDAHRIRIFGGQHIDGTIIVLINDDAAFARKSVYVSQLNAGSRVRVRNSANTFDYTDYTPIETQTDVEIELERTEESGTTAWRRTRVVHRDNKTATVNYNLSPPDSPYTNEYDLLRISGTIAEEKTIILAETADGKERKIYVENTTAILRFQDASTDSIFYTFDPAAEGGGDGVTFHFWRQSGRWRKAYVLRAQKTVSITTRSVLSSAMDVSFGTSQSKKILKVTNPDTGGTQKVVTLLDGAFIGQEFMLDHASPEWIEFRDSSATPIAALVFDVELSGGRKCVHFYWDGTWNFVGVTEKWRDPNAGS
jgi:hypothetical protein